MEPVTDSLLIIGMSDTGKTHYGGQVLIRLRKGRGLLRSAVAPDSIRAFDEVLNCLNDGRSAPHTASTFYGEARLPLIDASGRRIDLRWPEYAGEQMKTIREDRLMPTEWRARLLNSRGWIFFVRPDAARTEEDIILRPTAEDALGEAADVSNADHAKSKSVAWSEQASSIELLQMLLYAKGVGSATPVGSPYLTIILSCWDEIKAKKRKERIIPSEVLAETMPLFSEFISSNWQEGSRSVFGISSLSKALSDEVSDEEYQDKGPESFGYTVSPEGDETDDLTLPIARMLEHLA